MKTKIITFYLPQYYPTIENDLWWGKGFTDWRNVAKSRPRYFGHYQPQLPSDLGFYDLRNEETRIAQADLARDYGVAGFCYYHYWFNGRMLLERPFNEVLKSKKPDFPFCLCWANENWTRRWDGLETDILVEQSYSEYDSMKHIEWLAAAFKDERYIKVNGKPLFLVYNASGIPELSKRIQQWRENVKILGFDDIYLCSVKSIHNRLEDAEALANGFDAIVEFIPSSDMVIPRKLTGLPRYYLFKIFNRLIDMFGLNKIVPKLPITIIQDYNKFAEMRMNKAPKVKTFPCVIPSWDNSARKKLSASIQNNDPELFKKWLIRSIEKVKDNLDDERIVFVNAWNEWAEGCHLEPDLRNDKMFLEALRSALKETDEGSE